MKFTLKISLAAMSLALSVTSLLRADDQSVPVQPLPSTPPPSTASATTPGEGEKPARQRTMDPEQMLQRLSDRLSLTDDQKAKIRPLLKAQADQLAALHSDTSLSDDEKREKMRTIRQSLHEQLNPLLTSEQQEKLKGMRGGRDRDRDGHDAPPTPDAPPAASTPPPPST